MIMESKGQNKVFAFRAKVQSKRTGWRHQWHDNFSCKIFAYHIKCSVFLFPWDANDGDYKYLLEISTNRTLLAYIFLLYVYENYWYDYEIVDDYNNSDIDIALDGDIFLMTIVMLIIDNISTSASVDNDDADNNDIYMYVYTRVIYIKKRFWVSNDGGGQVGNYVATVIILSLKIPENSFWQCLNADV